MARGGKRAGSGRKQLDMDPQTRIYYNAYNMQRLHAGYRKIAWQFNFEEWLAWWGEDIVNRGQGKDKLVMARNGDIGPYHPDNVRKITHSQNSKENVKAGRHPRTEEFRELKRKQAIAQHLAKGHNIKGNENATIYNT